MCRNVIRCLMLCLILVAIPTSLSLAQPAISEISLDPAKQSVPSLWVSEMLLAVNDPAGQSLGPTAASRAYGMVGTSMYDAWSTYEPVPASTLLGDTLQQPKASNTLANKSEAVSYAAYTVLSDLFPDAGLRQGFRDRMTALGYDPDNASSTPATLGVTMANTLLNFRHKDGANQLNGYADTSGYQPVNSSSLNIVDIEAWTPEFVPIGDPAGSLQSPLHPHWGGVTPFALSSANKFQPPAPQRFLLDSNASYDLANRTITRADGTVVGIDASLIGIDISPGFINQTQEVVDYSAGLGDVGGDERKLIAEFWEDPPGTPYPPGSWMFIAQKVRESASPDLDGDIPTFFGVGNAVMDAGIATWEAKYDYEYARPVRVVRLLGELGLIGVENADGEFEIEAWSGVGEGTQTILAKDFLTYQTPGGAPSPPFPEFTSGHSAFSAAAAEFLQLLTGSDDLVLDDGTVGLSVVFEPGESRFEPGITPAEQTILEWLTYSQMADEAGISRLYGGIHFAEGDLFGRDLGSDVGGVVFDRVEFFLNGAIPEPSSGGMLLMALVIGTRIRKSKTASRHKSR